MKESKSGNPKENGSDELIKPVQVCLLLPTLVFWTCPATEVRDGSPWPGEALLPSCPPAPSTPSHPPHPGERDADSFLLFYKINTSMHLSHKYPLSMSVGQYLVGMVQQEVPARRTATHMTTMPACCPCQGPSVTCDTIDHS